MWRVRRDRCDGNAETFTPHPTAPHDERRVPSDIPHHRREIRRARYGSVVVVTWAVAARGAVVSSWIRLVAKRRLL